MDDLLMVVLGGMAGAAAVGERTSGVLLLPLALLLLLDSSTLRLLMASTLFFLSTRGLAPTLTGLLRLPANDVGEALVGDITESLSEESSVVGDRACGTLRAAG